MLRVHRLVLRRVRSVSRLYGTQWASTSAPLPVTSSATSLPRRPRSKWRRVAIASASVALFYGLSSSAQETAESPLRRQWLLMRCGWTLGSAFIEYVDVRSDLFDGGGEAQPAEDDQAREARRIQWWDAMQKARAAANSESALRWQDQLIWVLVHLLVPDENDDDQPEDTANRRDLVRTLVERGVLELLVDFVAIEKPSDPVLLEKILQCLELALDESIRIQNDPEASQFISVSAARLGVALGHIMDQEMPRYSDLVRLGESLLEFERLGSDPTTSRDGRTLTASHHIDAEFGESVKGYVRMLSPEMPSMMKEFAMNSLCIVLQSATRLPECTTTRQLDELFSPACASLILALPRQNTALQQSAAALTPTLVQIAQLSSVPVHEDVYDLWIQQVRWWARSANPSLQLASASCLRILSGHPRTRHLVRDSPESMEALFTLARQLHEAQVKKPPRTKKSKSKQSGADNQVFTLYDQVEQALIQKHLSKAFLNVCTSYKSGGTVILETMSSATSSFHTKRQLPMSKVFRSMQDVMDLPVYGAEEYESTTEFGWADILTNWTGSSDRDIRRNAIESLVHLVEQESESATVVQRQQVLLQAWLASMLQHVRNVTGGEEILAIKQVEDIARISDEFTPGNERIAFNPAVVDAGASALAILAEQHHDELIHYGVVPLMSLLAIKSPSNSDFDFATQSARVIANLVAACSKTLADQQNLSKQDHQSVTGMTRTSVTGEPFSYSHPLWRTFFAEVFDVGQMLHTTPSGQRLLQMLNTWRERDDPYERSQLYRALANLAAYRELVRSDSSKLPIYAEGVHPIVRYGDVADDVTTVTEADVDVVFVHGLRGDAFGTWRTDMGDAIDARTDVWPDVLLQEDLSSMGIRARILSLGYEAGMVSWSSPWPSLTLQERAKLMLNALYSAQVGGTGQLSDSPRPVVFVTHSMGGILVKKMLLQSISVEEEQSKLRQPLADCTKGVVFLAVPHFGSDLARGARSEAVRSLLRTHPAIQDLCASHDRRLESLNESFAELHIDCLSIAEQKPAPLGFGISAMVVKPDSANPGIGSFFVLPNADHMTICKAKHHEDPMYKSVLDYVMGHLRSTPHHQ